MHMNIFLFLLYTALGGFLFSIAAIGSSMVLNQIMKLLVFITHELLQLPVWVWPVFFVFLISLYFVYRHNRKLVHGKNNNNHLRGNYEVNSIGGVWPPLSACRRSCSGYLLENDGDRILIDCGNGVLSRLQKYLAPWELDAIVISHLHNDHISDLFILRYAQLLAQKGGRYRSGT